MKSKVRTDGWQPMATAPSSGKVLVFTSSGGPYVAMHGRYGWTVSLPSHNGVESVVPTMWAELPGNIE